MGKLTTGAQWAIERLQADFPGDFDATIALIEAIGLAKAYRTLSYGHPNTVDWNCSGESRAVDRILQAALCRDAVADLLGPLLQKRDAELQEIRKRVVELDDRTMRSRMIR